MIDAPFWVQALIFFLCVLLPLAVTVFGISVLRKARRFMANAQRVTGIVQSVKAATINDGQIVTTTYQPTFSFQLQDGSTHSAKTATAGTNMNYPVGSERQILVNPDMLDQVRMPGITIWVMGGIIVVFGLVFFAAGLFFLFAA